MSISQKNFSMMSARDTLAVAEEILDGCRIHINWLTPEMQIRIANSYLRLAEAKMTFLGPTAHYEEI